MLAHAVEAHAPREQYVAPQSRVVRRGEPTLRPIPLIEGHPERDRPTVEQQVIALGPHRTQADVALNNVDDLAPPVEQGQIGLDQRRRGGRPEPRPSRVVYPRIAQINAPRNLTVLADRVGVVRQDLLAYVQANSQAAVVAAFAGDLRGQADLPSFDAGLPS